MESGYHRQLRTMNTGCWFGRFRCEKFGSETLRTFSTLIPLTVAICSKALLRGQRWWASRPISNIPAIAGGSGVLSNTPEHLALPGALIQSFQASWDTLTYTNHADSWHGVIEFIESRDFIDRPHLLDSSAALLARGLPSASSHWMITLN